jgi:hypothetical protein
VVTQAPTSPGGANTGDDQGFPDFLTLQVPGVADHRYGGGRVWRVWPNGAEVPVLGWCPEVIERQDVISGTDRNGRPLITRSDYLVQVGSVERLVTMDSMKSGEAWAAIPDAPIAPTSILRDMLIGIVRDQAMNAPAVQVMERSGWHTAADGTRGYIYPDGAVWPADAPMRLAVDPNADLVEYCQHPEPVSDKILTYSIAALVRHSGPSIVGLAAGLRALATSIEHPRTSVLLGGKRGGGKTLGEWEADALTTGWGWPPHPVGSFSDTHNAVETLIGPVGDRAITIDDSPNGPNMGARKDAQAGDYLEMVIRSVANNREIRNRQDRKDPRKLRPSVKVHGLPIISVEHRPNSMRSSLMRRCVMVKYDETHKANTKWFKKNNHDKRLGPALRTMGDRTIAYIGSTDPAELRAWIRDRVDAWETYLDTEMKRRIPQFWEDEILSIATGAAQIMVGVDLLAAATKLDLADLRDATLSVLIDACEYTAEAASDEYTTNDDLGVALSEVINGALSQGRAYISTQGGDPAPCLPGMAPSEQGVRRIGDSSRWEPVGSATIPLYYVPELHSVPALAIRSESLRTLARSDADNRLSGMSAQTMPKRLVDAGAALPDIAGGRGGTTQTRSIGADDRPHRWVLIPADIIAGAAPDPLGGDEPTKPDAGTPPEPLGLFDQPDTADSGWPAGTIGAEAWTDADDSRGAQLGDGEHRQEPEQTAPVPLPKMVPAPRAAEPPAVKTPAVAPARVVDGELPAASAPVAGRRTQMQRSGKRSAASSAPAFVAADAPARVATLNGAALTLPDGTGVEAPADLPAVLAAVAGGAGTETALVLMERAFGLAATKPRQSSPWHKAFTPLVTAGWHAEGRPGEKPTVGAWTNLAHPEHGIVRLAVGPWLTTRSDGEAGGGEPFPYSLAEAKSRTEVDAGELARRLRHFAELTGTTYRGTRANSAVTLFRNAIAATAQRTPRWQTTAPLGPQDVPLDWAWSAGDGAPEGTTVFSFDRNLAHLAPTREVRIAMDDLGKTGAIKYDPGLAGFFRITVPEWPWPDLPAPTSQTGIAWVTGPVLKQYARMMLPFKILESWSAKGVQPQGSRAFVKTVTDAYEALADEATGKVRPEHAAVGEAVKGLYQTLHGKLDASRSRITRPDWGLAIRDESWITGLRLVYQIAGVSEAGDVPEGPRPLRMNMDEITYALPKVTEVSEAAAKLGLTMGTKQGQYKAKPPIPADQWAVKDGGK